MSKKTVYIDTENLSVDLDNTILQDPSRISESPITDLIRFSCGHFLNVSKKNINVYSDEYKLSDFTTIAINNETETIQLKADTNAFNKKIVNSQGLIQNIFDYKRWESFITDNFAPIYGLSYFDHYSDIERPTNIVETNSDVNGANIFNREFSYNFYSPEYEQLTANQSIDEFFLPNIYDHLRDRRADIDTPTENLKVSLGGLVPEYLSQGVLQSTKISENGKKYFSEYAKKINSSQANIVLNEIQQLKDPVVTVDDFTLNTLPPEIFNNTPFPLATKILFKSNVDTALINKLQEKQITDLLIGSISTATTKTQITNPATKNFYGFDVESGRLDSAEVIVFDFKNFIQSNLIPQQSGGDASNSFDINLNANLISLVDYIKKNYTTKRRKYSELTNKAATSILFYKLIKKPNTSKASPMQTYYIATNKADMVKFIDTQVKYDKNYVYELEAATLVVGNKYKYTDDYYKTETEKNNDLKNGFYRLNVVNASSMQIVFIPIASFAGSVVQAPPTKPDIEIGNIKRKLSMKVNKSAEYETERQEIIEDADFAKFKKVSVSQENLNDLIKFDNKSETRTLQIYKTINRPKFYSDFNGKLYKTLTISNSFVSLEDDIIPNVDYYYTFRYLNEHDLPSNPSKVYKVSIKDEDGLVYLQKEVINLEKELLVGNDKSFKKYLYITPSINQKIVNNNIDMLEEKLANSNDASIIDLGVEKSSVWDKQFIMIVRSKDSGRQLKYRFKFNLVKQKE